MVRKILATLLLIGIASAGLLEKPDFSKVGTSGAAFLKINTSARIQGLAGAFSAIANDVTGMTMNPAGLGNLTRPQVSINYTKWIADINYGYIAVGFPVKFGAFGIQAGMLSIGDMEETTLEEPEGTGFTFSASSMVFGMTYARAMTDKLTFGITGKFIRESIKRESATGLAVDLGSYYRTGFKSLRIAMAINNFGTSMRFKGPDLDYPVIPSDWQDEWNYAGGPLPLSLKSSSYSLPLMFRLGIAYDFIDNGKNLLTGDFDLLHPNDGQEKFALGFEYTFDRIFSLRVGYKLDPDKYWDQESKIEGLSAGTGLKLRLPNALLNIDYAFVNNGKLGFNHFVTVGYSF
ncbi:MAG: PorV/PorQ family protein [Candidatus Hydrothermae bacterium]|nr:PorV/PorQ family protein [Candidatus Hydrothermae bacterium]